MLIKMKYFKVLYVQVIIGIIAGIFVGWAFPGFSPTAKLISETFINMIRMVIAPVIFFTIVSGIAGAGDMKKVGRVGLKALIYFEVVTTLALIIGLVTANVVKPGAGVTVPRQGNAQVEEISKQASQVNWGEFFSHIVPSNVVDAFAKGEILQVLFFSVLFAIALKMMGNSGKALLGNFESINKVLFNVLKIIMKLSPIGAFGGECGGQNNEAAAGNTGRSLAGEQEDTDHSELLPKRQVDAKSLRKKDDTHAEVDGGTVEIETVSGRDHQSYYFFFAAGRSKLLHQGGKHGLAAAGTKYD